MWGLPVWNSLYSMNSVISQGDLVSVALEPTNVFTSVHSYSGFIT